MKYQKVAKTYEEQADILISRGLKADRSILIERLQSVDYYRLNGYLFPFRKDDEFFIEGTCFDNVWRCYTFDRRLGCYCLMRLSV